MTRDNNDDVYETDETANGDYDWASDMGHWARGSRGHRGPRGSRGFGPGGHRPPGPGGPWLPPGMEHLPWAQLMKTLGRQFGNPAQGGEWGGRRGPRARRGDVRAAILDVLAGDEMNGYQLIQQISERTNGAWKPSPGSVYPTVQQLEDEGLVEGREVEGRRMLRLTDAGRSYVEEHADEMAATWRPFEQASDDRQSRGPADNLMPLAGQVMSAMWQVTSNGTSQQRAEAAEILTETRRKLYSLLAEGDPE